MESILNQISIALQESYEADMDHLGYWKSRPTRILVSPQAMMEIKSEEVFKYLDFHKSTIEIDGIPVIEDPTIPTWSF